MGCRLELTQTSSMRKAPRARNADTWLSLLRPPGGHRAGLVTLARRRRILLLPAGRAFSGTSASLLACSHIIHPPEPETSPDLGVACHQVTLRREASIEGWAVPPQRLAIPSMP